MIVMVFSCLVDADTIDTADFCGEYPVNRSLHTDFSKCLSKICDKINSFTAVTDLQKERKKVQSQVYRKIDSEAEIFIFQMPTGSGKTLCSMRFALERAIRKNKKRIIYVMIITEMGVTLLPASLPVRLGSKSPKPLTLY